MTRLESSGRKQRIKGNPRQAVGWTNIIILNLLMPRRRSRPQLDWPVHYKYRAPVSLFHISAIAVRAKSAQAVAGSNNFVRKFSGRARKWCTSFWVGSSVQLVSIFLLGAFSLSWLLIATRILFLVKVKVLRGWLCPVVRWQGYRQWLNEHNPLYSDSIT